MIRLLLVTICLVTSTARADEPAVSAEATKTDATPAPASDAPLRIARDTADVGKKGAWSVGLFNPLRYAIADGLELEAHPIFFFTAPHATVRVAHVTGDLRVTGEYGLSIPTFGMRLTQGFLFPTYAEGVEKIGWFVTPSAGVAVSGGASNTGVWTARADLAIGIPLGDNSATPQHSFLAPLDLLFAPQLTGYRARLGGAYDLPLTAGLRLLGELNVYVVGADGDLVVNGQSVGPLRELSPIYLTGHVALDIALFESSRLSVGCYAANYDQGAIVVSKGSDGFAQDERVRSWNLIPTFDFIWSGG